MKPGVALFFSTPKSPEQVASIRRLMEDRTRGKRLDFLILDEYATFKMVDFSGSCKRTPGSNVEGNR